MIPGVTNSQKRRLPTVAASSQPSLRSNDTTKLCALTRLPYLAGAHGEMELHK